VESRSRSPDLVHPVVGQCGGVGDGSSTTSTQASPRIRWVGAHLLEVLAQHREADLGGLALASMVGVQRSCCGELGQ
jgi:hypothetical protein